LAVVIFSPTRHRAIESQAAGMITPQRHLGENASRRDNFASGIISPTRQGPVGAYAAPISRSTGDLDERARRRRVLSSPTRYGAIAPYATTMIARSRDLDEGAVGRLGSNSPARHGAVAPQGASLVESRGDLDEGAIGRRGLPIIIPAPARHRAIAPQGAGVPKPRRDLDEGACRRRELADATSPADHAAVAPYAAGKRTPDRHLDVALRPEQRIYFCLGVVVGRQFLLQRRHASIERVDLRLIVGGRKLSTRMRHSRS